MTEQKRPDLFPIIVGRRINEEISELRRAGVQHLVIGIPWEMLLPHEAQAKNNHGGQSLRRLAERGGLGTCEAVAVLEDRPWHTMPGASAHHRLAGMVARFNADCARAEAEAEFRATGGF